MISTALLPVSLVNSQPITSEQNNCRSHTRNSEHHLPCNLGCRSSYQAAAELLGGRLHRSTDPRPPLATCHIHIGQNTFEVKGNSIPCSPRCLDVNLQSDLWDYLPRVSNFATLGKQWESDTKPNRCGHRSGLVTVRCKTAPSLFYCIQCDIKNMFCRNC